MHSICAKNEREIMQQEKILKIVKENTKYFIAGYFVEALSNGIKTYEHLKNLSDAEAMQVARAVFKKLLDLDQSLEAL